MRQRGRKSPNLPAIRVDGSPSPLVPPAGLRHAERILFAEIISATSTNHFRPTDAPLIVSFVQATLAARKSARDPGRIGDWEKCVRIQASLATRLRLSPQSRTDPKTVGRMEQSGLRKPWEAIKEPVA